MADLVQTATNVIGDGTNVEWVISGGVTAGNSVYLDTDDNTYKASLADAAATVGKRKIALNTAADGQPLQIQSGGDIDLGATLVIGTVYVTSAAVAGAIAPEADIVSTEIVNVLGIADATDNLDMDFDSKPVVP